MEQLRNINLPIAGRIQHGEQQILNNKQRVVELGYFIAKIKNENLRFLANRFNEQYFKKQSIEIQFFNDMPLTIRRVRYNQSGAVCYCQGNNEAKLKDKGKWTMGTCSNECSYRTPSKEGQKPQCNVEGILKFIIPTISTDRVWYMKITGQTSIARIKAYINLQNNLGNSMIGKRYNIFMKEEVQTNKLGKTFTNFILDIVQKDLNINSTSEFGEDTVTDNHLIEQELIEPQNSITDNKEIIINETVEIPETTSVLDTTYKDSYVLLDTELINIDTKDGEKEYVQANVVDMNDKEFNVIINPKDTEELLKYDSGTVMKLELVTIQNMLFSQSITYLHKSKKNAVA